MTFCDVFFFVLFSQFFRVAVFFALAVKVLCFLSVFMIFFFVGGDVLVGGCGGEVVIVVYSYDCVGVIPLGICNSPLLLVMVVVE